MAASPPPAAWSGTAQRVFLDTNIFVYVFDASAPQKQALARDLVKACLSRGNGVVSYQVVQEFTNVALQKMRRPMSTHECTQVVTELLLPLLRVNFSPELLRSALAIRDEARYHWYDSLVLAAAAEARCDLLYSEDLQHHQVVRHVRIQNPFLNLAHEAA